MQTFHYRFEDRAAFAVAALKAGWISGLEGEWLPPAGTAYDEIGPLIAAPSLAANLRPIAGAIIDARWHVNVLWPQDEPSPAFAAALVTPREPARAFALPPVEPPPPPPVPGLMAAWKGKEVLATMGLLEAAEAAVAAAGGRLANAWHNAAEWERESEMLAAMAAVLGLTRDQVDELFRQAAAIRG